MMKTILVLTSGSDSDAAVFDTALAVATPLGAHLAFLHVHVSPAEAAQYTPHIDYASGEALKIALDLLRDDAAARSLAARNHFEMLCDTHKIPILDVPSPSAGLTAAWREEKDDASDRILLQARHSDLVVIGRRTGADGLPSDLAERLLLGSGKPLLIASPGARRDPTATVMVCWKENDTSARALSAALPLLVKSKRVVIVTAEESAAGSPTGMTDLAGHLAWHGIAADVCWLPADGRPIAERLETAATRYGADMLVMGGYGRGRLREAVFGGCTRNFLDYAELPVLMMH